MCLCVRVRVRVRVCVRQRVSQKVSKPVRLPCFKSSHFITLLISPFTLWPPSSFIPPSGHPSVPLSCSFWRVANPDDTSPDSSCQSPLSITLFDWHPSPPPGPSLNLPYPLGALCLTSGDFVPPSTLALSPHLPQPSLLVQDLKPPVIPMILGSILRPLPAGAGLKSDIRVITISWSLCPWIQIIN